jgi:sigma-54 specific flagellar transcriptional regulator A
VDIHDLPEKYRTLAPAPGGMGNAPQRGDALASSLPLARLPADGLDLRGFLSDLEYSLIVEALQSSNGVVAHAARRLRIHRTTLVEKMRKYGLLNGRAAH